MGYALNRGHGDYRREVLQKALRELKSTVPVGEIKVRWEVATAKGKRFDAELRFENIPGSYAVEMLRDINLKMLEVLELKMKSYDRQAILVTNEITPAVAKELRERKIQFIDTLGNVFLYQDEPYINVFIADCLPKKPIVDKQPNPFTWTKLQVILTLLTNDEAVNFTYREIADKAGVALGTVNLTVNSLQRLGYIRRYRHKRKLMNREKLVFKWLEEYPVKIRPKLNPKRFDVHDRYWWVQADLEKYGAVVGGGTAAGVLTRYIHPGKGVLYTDGGLKEIGLALKLKANPDGNLTVMDRFWKGDNLLVNNVPIAPPLIVCAELLAEGGERNRESADIILKDRCGL